jgi:hypothetical protein
VYTQIERDETYISSGILQSSLGALVVDIGDI